MIANWETLPAKLKEPKKITSVNGLEWQFDNVAMHRLLKPFVGDDILRPVMTGVHFNDHAIEATNSHIAFYKPLKNSKKGVFAYSIKKSFQDQINYFIPTEKEKLFTVEGTYPNLERVIPESGTDVFTIDVLKLHTFCKAAIEFSNPENTQGTFFVETKAKGKKIVCYNFKFLITILETAYKLGYKELDAHFTDGMKPFVFTPVGKNPLDDVTLLVMPIFINEDDEENLKKFDRAGARDIEEGKYFYSVYNLSNNSIESFESEDITELKHNLTKDDLSLVKSNINTRNTLPVLDYAACLDGQLITSNLETYVCIDNSGLEEGLYQFSRSGDIFRAPKKDSTIANFPSIEQALKDEDLKELCTLNMSTAWPLIKAAQTCIGNDELRPVMGGVFFNFKKYGLDIVGTDAHKLFFSELNVDHNFETDYTVKISKALLKAFSSFDKCTIYKSEKYVLHDFLNGIKIYSRLIDAKFYNWEAVVPKDNPHKAEFNAKSLTDAVKQGKKFRTKESTGNVVLKNAFSGPNFKLIAQRLGYENKEEISTKEIGSFEVETNREPDPKPALLVMPVMLNDTHENSFGFNANVLEAVTKTYPKGTIHLAFSAANRAGIFYGELTARKTKYQRGKHHTPKVKNSSIQTRIDALRIAYELEPSKSIKNRIESLEIAMSL